MAVCAEAAFDEVVACCFASIVKVVVDVLDAGQVASRPFFVGAFEGVEEGGLRSVWEAMSFTRG